MGRSGVQIKFRGAACARAQRAAVRLPPAPLRPREFCRRRSCRRPRAASGSAGPEPDEGRRRRRLRSPARLGGPAAAPCGGSAGARRVARPGPRGASAAEGRRRPRRNPRAGTGGEGGGLRGGDPWTASGWSPGSDRLGPAASVGVISWQKAMPRPSRYLMARSLVCRPAPRPTRHHVTE